MFETFYNGPIPGGVPIPGSDHPANMTENGNLNINPDPDQVSLNIHQLSHNPHIQGGNFAIFEDKEENYFQEYRYQPVVTSVHYQQ
jgi:hypothetical protein